MPRAIRSFAAAALALLCWSAPSLAQSGNVMDGIGLIDYTRKPTFKVGTYVQYHMTGHSSKGHSEDYRMVVGVAGEERFWGDDGFWLETIAEGSGDQPGTSVASLMSYSIFSDSLPAQHVQYYMRKSINDTDERGMPHEVVSKGLTSGIKSHTKVDPNTHWYSDTLASDSILAMGRKFWCKRLHSRRDLAKTEEHGDSTIMTEYREDRDTYLSREVPLTSIVREDIEYLETRKAWLVGRSADAQSAVSIHSVGQSILLGYGYDYRGQVIDESKRHALPDRAVVPANSTKKAAKGGAKKSG